MGDIKWSKNYEKSTSRLLKSFDKEVELSYWTWVASCKLLNLEFIASTNCYGTTTWKWTFKIHHLGYLRLELDRNKLLDCEELTTLTRPRLI